MVISTAEQDNFGISVVEAVRCGCFPLLPRRLSYPELIPEELHNEVLYRDEQDLVDKLGRLLAELPRASPGLASKLRRLALSMNRFSWQAQIGNFDAELDRLAAKDRPGGPSPSSR